MGGRGGIGHELSDISDADGGMEPLGLSLVGVPRAYEVAGGF